MRGAVTVAAAQTLPPETPGRSLLVLVAFLVAVGSLLLQGGTLGRLVRRGVAQHLRDGLLLRALMRVLDWTLAHRGVTLVLGLGVFAA